MKLIFISLLLFLTPLTLHAETTDDLKTKFSESYQAFQKATQQANISKKQQCAIEKLALTSQQLGCQLYGESSQNCYNLQLNYVGNICPKKNNIEKAQKSYTKILANPINTDLTNEELLDLYIDILNSKIFVRYKTEFTIEIFNKVLEITEEYQESDPFLASYIIASINASHFNYKKHKNLIINAYEVLKTKLPKDDPTLYSHAYAVSSILVREREYENAITVLEESVAKISSLTNRDTVTEMKLRGQLIYLYEKIRESDKATVHCQAIGSMKPWNDNQEQQALLRVQPKYPSSAAKQGLSQWVKLSFSISQYGFVEDVKVLEHGKITRNIAKEFNKESIKALEKWRFAPKFSNGEPIKAENLTVQLDYAIRQN